MVGCYHWLDGHEFAQALGFGDGQGSLACCSPWGRKDSDMTGQLNWHSQPWCHLLLFILSWFLPFTMSLCISPFLATLIFTWRKIALQNFAFFSQTSTRTSNRCTVALPSWTSLPSPSPGHPSRLSQSPCLNSLSHTTNSHWLSVLHMVL